MPFPNFLAKPSTHKMYVGVEEKEASSPKCLGQKESFDTQNVRRHKREWSEILAAPTSIQTISLRQSAVPGRYYNKWLALTGCVLCLLIMFIVNWWAALVTLVVVTILYKYVEWMKPDANWGSASQVSPYRALAVVFVLFSLTGAINH
jgi:hypothetical protein